MVRILKQTVIAFGAALVLALGISTVAMAAEAGEMIVNGIGVVTADPDVAKISVYFTNNQATADAAQQENNKAIEKVTKALKTAGISSDNMIMEYAGVSPNYSYDSEKGEREPADYEAYATLEITTQDVGNAGKYIDVALGAGASGYNSVRFSLKDPSQYYGQALTVAVRNAEDSAKALAAAYGKPLGALRSVSENTSAAYYETANESAARGGAMADYGESKKTVIQHDKIQITARISAAYYF